MKRVFEMWPFYLMTLILLVGCATTRTDREVCPETKKQFSTSVARGVAAVDPVWKGEWFIRLGPKSIRHRPAITVVKANQ